MITSEKSSRAKINIMRPLWCSNGPMWMWLWLCTSPAAIATAHHRMTQTGTRHPPSLIHFMYEPYITIQTESTVYRTDGVGTGSDALARPKIYNRLHRRTDSTRLVVADGALWQWQWVLHASYSGIHIQPPFFSTARHPRSICPSVTKTLARASRVVWHARRRRSFTIHIIMYSSQHKF